jgi:L-ascorbate metabolism protein UlaG (beta-lactamase superfamily)
VAENIRWLGHDSFLITGQAVIYTDPYKINVTEPKADIILVTHDHGDHCSPDDVSKVQQAGTVIITTQESAKKLSGDIRVVKPGDKLTVAGVEIEVVPAYNTNKFRSPGQPFHPKEAGMAGFVFKTNGLRYYLVGDSDIIPEMKGLAPDVAFIPVSGKYVMTWEEAVEAAKDIQPKLAIPMHYGAGVAGTQEDADNFAAQCPTPVEVLKAG